MYIRHLVTYLDHAGRECQAYLRFRNNNAQNKLTWALIVIRTNNLPVSKVLRVEPKPTARDRRRQNT